MPHTKQVQSHHRNGRSLGKSLRACAFAFVFLLLASFANGQLIWQGSTSSSPADIFKAIGTGNVESPSTISTANDATRGTVWRFHKPSGSNRCENHGIKVGGTSFVFEKNNVYYLGWYTKLTNTADNNANFQWKSYGDHTQNFPIVLKMRSGNIICQQTQPGGVSTVIWEKPFNANTWYHIALGIRVDDGLQDGWVELWFNGVKQTFNTGSQRYPCRTFDGGHNCPKWGAYGRSDLDISNYLDDLKVGRSYNDVAMSGSSGGTFSGYYRLMARHSGKALVVQSASTSDGAAVVQYTYGGSNTNDEWELRSIGSGYYRIINRNSGKDMVVSSASTADGAGIVQYTYGGSNTNDEWQLVDVGGGYYRITNRNSGKSVEVSGSSTSEGAAVNQRTYSGGTNQQFQLISVGVGARMASVVKEPEETIAKEILTVQNPIGQQTPIHLWLETDGKAELALYDNNGRQVRLLLSKNLQRGQQTILLESSGLASGTYYLRFQQAGKTTVKRLVKQ